MIRNILSLTAMSMLLMACSSIKQAKYEKNNARAELMTANKKVIGEVKFKETGKGVEVVAEITGLEPKSVHGFHIHENGKCEGPDFKSAGGHFNPRGKPHAGPGAHHQHLGDFGNIVANEKGVAKKELLIKNRDIKSLEVVMNKAIILHQNPDDLVSQPSGNSGDRMACGLIQTAKK